MIFKKVLQCDEEYYKSFCSVSQKESIKRYRDDSLKDMYYHNFSIIKGEFEKESLAESIEEEVSLRKEEGAEFCNIFLENVPEYNLESLTDIKAEVSLSGYYYFHIDRLGKMPQGHECVIKRAHNNEMIEDIVYADLQNDEKILGRDFCERRARRKGKVYISEQGADAYICYYNNEIVGTCELFIKDGWAKIEDFTVIERFQRMGFGTAILKYLIDVAVSRGAENIYLMTGEEDTAKEMYLKLGFEKIGEKNELFFKFD